MDSREQIIRCACGWSLGLVIAGWTVIRLNGREWIGEAKRIRCERCGSIWQPDAPAGTATGA